MDFDRNSPNGILEVKPAPHQRNMGIFLMCMGFFVIFTLGSFAAAWFAVLSPYLVWRDTQTWTKVPCRIGQSEVVTTSQEEDDDGHTYYMYSLRVRYTYAWENATYEGSQVHVTGFQSSSTTNRADWEELQKKYPVGSSMECFVNPRNPSQAFLDVAFPSTDFLLGMGMTVIFLFCGILFLVVGIKVA